MSVGRIWPKENKHAVRSVIDRSWGGRSLGTYILGRDSHLGCRVRVLSSASLIAIRTLDAKVDDCLVALAEKNRAAVGASEAMGSLVRSGNLTCSSNS